MTYKLTFLPQALKEWKKLDLGTQQKFKEKLRESLENPEVPKDKCITPHPSVLRGFPPPLLI
jgi:mRNA interferase RelE/StbE